jgi:hypothetical protein
MVVVVEKSVEWSTPNAGPVLVPFLRLALRVLRCCFGREDLVGCILVLLHQQKSRSERSLWAIIT